MKFLIRFLSLYILILAIPQKIWGQSADTIVLTDTIAITEENTTSNGMLNSSEMMPIMLMCIAILGLLIVFLWMRMTSNRKRKSFRKKF